MTVTTEIVTGQSVSRHAKQQRVRTTLAASATSPTAAYGSSPAVRSVALGLKCSALEERLHHRMSEHDQRADRRNRDEVHQPQTGHDASRHAAAVLARELGREQRKDYRRDCGSKDLLREVHQLVA